MAALRRGAEDVVDRRVGRVGEAVEQRGEAVVLLRRERGHAEPRPHAREAQREAEGASAVVSARPPTLDDSFESIVAVMCLLRMRKMPRTVAVVVFGSATPAWPVETSVA